MIDPIADSLIQLYWKDQHDRITVNWNLERKKLILELLNNILYPNFVKKLKLKLIDEAEDGIIAQCRAKFHDIISQGTLFYLYSSTNILKVQFQTKIFVRMGATMGAKRTGIVRPVTLESCPWLFQTTSIYPFSLLC